VFEPKFKSLFRAVIYFVDAPAAVVPRLRANLCRLDVSIPTPSVQPLDTFIHSRQGYTGTAEHATPDAKQAAYTSIAAGRPSYLPPSSLQDSITHYSLSPIPAVYTVLEEL
jgi:hypothetical protein